MTIDITYIEEPIKAVFVPYGPNERRLWLRNTDQWFPTIGWCPHINMNGVECGDCALNVE